ncbi:hypothetical protein GGS21DRAFT_494092 [Xylaria nigripes]|nr:hypothetical protein GGS21DRAFT_494092 [Xylaria nigripes]
MDDGRSHLALTLPCPGNVHHSDFNLDSPSEHMLSSSQGLNFPSDAHTAGKDPITRFVLIDGPWHPRNLTSGAHGSGGQLMVSNTHHAQFIVPGHSIINPQSDSGYESYHNHHSVAHGSVCDDAQSTMGRSMVEAQFPIPDSLSRNTMGLGLSDAWSNPIRSENNSLVCEICQKEMKTKSELKKHDQRHKKPFKCEIKGCLRQDGFSTANDLDRHKRSVHPTSQALGKFYVCPFGHCQRKDKRWPRADNFRAHLKRVHSRDEVSDQELEGYVYKPPSVPHGPQDHTHQETISNDASSLANEQRKAIPSSAETRSTFSSGLLSESGWSHIHHADAVPDQEAYQKTTGLDQASHSAIASPSPVHADQVSRVPEVPVSNPCSDHEEVAKLAGDISIEAISAEIVAPSADASQPDLLDESSESSPRDRSANIPAGHVVRSDCETSCSIEPESCLTDDRYFSYLSLGKLDLSNEKELRKLIEFLHSRGVLEQFGYKKKDPEVDSGAINQDNSHRCHTCNKTFPRKCELRKHEKRHARPYVCTVPTCNKKFGSKNDWKRHEKTQHVGSGCSCDEAKTGDSSENCAMVCDRRDIGREHLEKDYQRISEREIGERMNFDSSLSQKDLNDNFDDRDGSYSAATNSDAQPSLAEEIARPPHRSKSKRKWNDSKSIGKSKKTKALNSSAGGYVADMSVRGPHNNGIGGLFQFPVSAYTVR